MKIYRSYSSEETKRFGAKIARRALDVRRKKSDSERALVPRQTRDKCALVLALKGDLGSGKTTFAQGFLRGLGIRARVNSPTFILIKRYKLKTSSKGGSASGRKNYNLAFHIDCYRIKKPKELLDLGLREILSDPQNIVLIEWAERISRTLPKSAKKIRFGYGTKEKERVLKFGDV